MKINVGILGFGNLGKAVAHELINDARFNLVAVFTHRKSLTNEEQNKVNNVKLENINNIGKYKRKIKIMFLCGGSSSTLQKDARLALKYFNTIDAFDTHAKIKKYIKSCDKLAKTNKKVAFCSIGWDPGLFSGMRVLFNSLDEKTYTIWGKGVSQGHSEAIRRIEGVKDAVQYTVPNKGLINKLKLGELTDGKLHKRECLVVADKKDQKRIENEIKNMPNYFLGYNTKVSFVSQDEILQHKALFHRGEVFTLGNNFNFSLKTNSNPSLTSKIMLSYAIAMLEYIKNKRYGAYSILDIPFAQLLKNSDRFI